MIIQNMFEEDINRPINGVIKVDPVSYTHLTLPTN